MRVFLFGADHGSRSFMVFPIKAGRMVRHVAGAISARSSLLARRLALFFLLRLLIAFSCSRGQFGRVALASPGALYV